MAQMPPSPALGNYYNYGTQTPSQTPADAGLCNRGRSVAHARAGGAARGYPGVWMGRLHKITGYPTPFR